jgi:Xaa-Pro aminopeptidase
MIQRYFPLEEYRDRWARVQAAMQALSLEVAIVCSRSAGTYDRCADLLYLANYYGNQPGQGRRGPQGFAVLVLRRGEEPQLLADVQDLRPELLATDRFEGCANSFESVARIVRELGSRRVGLIGSDTIPMRYWIALQAQTPDTQWIIADELIRQVRLIKSARELDAFRQAGRVVSDALGALMQALIAGASEAEAAAEAARLVFRGGGHVHMLAVSHGPYLSHLATDPLTGFSSLRPSPGDLARAWITGPMFQGYWLGPGRTVVCARSPTPAQRALLEANARAVQDVVAEIRPGISVRQLVAHADARLLAADAEPSSLSREWPVYGHGNGLFFEAPTISIRVGSDADFVLQENMVLSIEMFLSRSGVGEAGFENNVIVTSNGSELLSTAPMLP